MVPLSINVRIELTAKPGLDAQDAHHLREAISTLIHEHIHFPFDDYAYQIEVHDVRVEPIEQVGEHVEATD